MNFYKIKKLLRYILPLITYYNQIIINILRNFKKIYY